MFSIGIRIRYYRKKNGLTLQELSQRTSLSVAYLSNIEREATSPTIQNVQIICQAIAINIVDLINESIPFKPVIRKNERESVYSKNYGVNYEYWTDCNQKLVGKVQTLTDEVNGTQCHGHETDEIGIVIKGSLKIEIYGYSFILEEGDSVYVKASTEHVVTKLSEGDCISYWSAINVLRCVDTCNNTL
jgi:transcriptional regulator with XRE-family HTH domain